MLDGSSYITYNEKKVFSHQASATVTLRPLIADVTAGQPAPGK